MNIGIFGGSFNPPHIGHKKIIQSALNQFDEVWVMVSNNPMKKYNVSFQDRVEMCKLAFNTPNVIISTFEENKEGQSTYQILKQLQELHPEHKFTLIIGSDQLAIFNYWDNYQELLEEFNIICFSRTKNWLRKLILKLNYPEVKWMKLPVMDISSTDIRKNINHTVKGLEIEVYSYILKHRLYGIV